MNHENPASHILVMAGDEIEVIIDAGKALAGEGVNVGTANAESMGDELMVILTGDCYDHAPRLASSPERCSMPLSSPPLWSLITVPQNGYIPVRLPCAGGGGHQACQLSDLHVRQSNRENYRRHTEATDIILRRPATACGGSRPLQ